MKVSIVEALAEVGQIEGKHGGCRHRSGCR